LSLWNPSLCTRIVADLEARPLELFLEVYDDLLEDLFEAAAAVLSQPAKVALNSSHICCVAFQKLNVAQGLFHHCSPFRPQAPPQAMGCTVGRYQCGHI
jgi:hypothetical protein